MQSELSVSLGEWKMRSVFRSVDLPEVAEVVDSDIVVFAVKFEQVYAYFFSLARGKFMRL